MPVAFGEGPFLALLAGVRAGCIFGLLADRAAMRPVDTSIFGIDRSTIRRHQERATVTSGAPTVLRYHQSEGEPSWHRPRHHTHSIPPGGHSLTPESDPMSLADEDDASLVARCRDRDPAAWEALVRRYQRLVYAIVRRAGLDEHAAADVFQTVFARLLAHLPRISQPDRLQAWIVTTAKRETLLTLKRAQRTISMTRDDNDDDSGRDGAASVVDIADDALLPEQLLDEIQQLVGLRHALDRLDQRCRELLGLLFRADDDKVSYDDIARRMKMSIGSIGPTRSRCLSRLRALVEKQ